MTDSQLQTLIDELAGVEDPRYLRKVRLPSERGDSQIAHIPPFSIPEMDKKRPDYFHGFYGKLPSVSHSIDPKVGSTVSIEGPECGLLGYRNKLHLEHLKGHLSHLGRFYVSPVVSKVFI